MDSQLTNVFNRMGILDFIFLIPMFFLFAYLPDDHIWSIFVNLVIVVFFSFGLVMAVHSTVNYFKNRAN
ncbi:DUF6007 family protein [Alkalibacillus almallahensis]|uniref:DUF6007 family protein n=1 Tax=Alkalibacillus almallahensis TaxID=1379154 RepID=UPI00142381C9|nr:DUF6007 family protein [Alkalibacillus almallahensis]NIK13008.1 hypothetical protein [Alkalibacillus almallahensis]